MHRWRPRSVPGAFRLALIAVLPVSWAFAVPGDSHPALAAPAESIDARLGRALDDYAKPLIDRGDLSGQLLVARHGEIVLERSFGFANRELQVPVTPDSRFCVASVTKPMTLLIALRTIEQKRIGYRDSIARWLPGFPRGDSITIEHLLRHRSGIPHRILPDSLATRPRTAAEMVELASHLPLDFPPGTRSSYSSGGYTVLARILEIANGMDYQNLLEEHLFRPLGMAHSRHVDATVLLPDRATAYRPGLHGLENARLEDFSGLVGAGSVWSTARDLHRFVQGVVTGRLGSPVRQSLVRRGKLEFSGRTGGFRAYADWDSATNLEVVFTGNTQTGAADLLRAAVPQLAAGGSPLPLALPTLSQTPLDERTLRDYEGVFQLETGTRLIMTVREGALWANDWPLLPTRDGAFFSLSDYGQVRGIAGADGRIERLDWTQAGKVYPAPRVSDGP